MKEELRELVETYAGTDITNDAVDLFSDLGFDALDFWNLTEDIEEKHNVSFSAQELDEINTFNDLYNLLEIHL